MKLVGVKSGSVRIEKWVKNDDMDRRERVVLLTQFRPTISSREYPVSLWKFCEQ
jgi:hypothetical protein